MARQGGALKQKQAGGASAQLQAAAPLAPALRARRQKLQKQKPQRHDPAEAPHQPGRKRQKGAAPVLEASRHASAVAESSLSHEEDDVSEQNDIGSDQPADSPSAAEASSIGRSNAAAGAAAGRTADRKRQGGAAGPGEAEVAAATHDSLAAAGLETVPVAALRAAEAANGAVVAAEPFRNKEKVLMLTSRGIPPRHRHLMLDLGQLLPTAKRDSKLDTKSDRAVINEAAELKGCSSAMFFEARKRRDCYLWLAKVPAGPTAKFLIVNVHTMAELKLSGNHLKGSRPVLSFDKEFESAPHWGVLREVLTHVFATPKRHHKAKPFFDHVISFSIADGRIWLRNYQVTGKPAPGEDATSLVEVGPRACLNPILIFSGAFGGPIIWENPGYVSPNDLRAAEKRKAAGKYIGKVKKRAARRLHVAENAIPRGELDDVFRN